MRKPRSVGVYHRILFFAAFLLPTGTPHRTTIDGGSDDYDHDGPPGEDPGRQAQAPAGLAEGLDHPSKPVSSVVTHRQYTRRSNKPQACKYPTTDRSADEQLKYQDRAEAAAGGLCGEMAPSLSRVVASSRRPSPGRGRNLRVSALA
ncbi:hypothetical protein C8Q77DRAFT_144424 [Trametes polyzona]|nr:hypothetical protein C8Q77DRAFT_144424 [Trametes polyzona]